MVVATVAAEPASGQTGYDCHTCDLFAGVCTTDAPSLDGRCVEAASGEWCSSWGNLMDCGEVGTEEELLAIVPIAIGATGTVVASPVWLAQGMARVFAPTPAILTSEAFLLSHCFGIADESDASRIGLTFRPLRGVQHVDVEGTVWMDPDRGDVIEIEFTFTEIIDFLTPDASRIMHEARLRFPNSRLRFAGITPFFLRDVRGRIEYTRLDDGPVVLKRWEMASPYLDYTTSSDARFGIDIIGQIRALVTSFDVLAIFPSPPDAPRK